MQTSPAAQTPPNSDTRKRYGAAPWQQAWQEITNLVQSAHAALQKPSSVPLRRWTIPLIWVLGIIGDAVTTIFMMRSGDFEEGNPVAAAGMGILGVGGYTALVSVACLVLAAANAGRPRGIYGHTVWVALAVIGIIKTGVAVDNLLLWTATGHYGI